MKDVGGAVLAGSTPPFLGRERAAVDVDVGPERRSPRYHETCLALESVKDDLTYLAKLKASRCNKPNLPFCASAFPWKFMPSLFPHSTHVPAMRRSS